MTKVNGAMEQGDPMHTMKDLRRPRSSQCSSVLRAASLGVLLALSPLLAAGEAAPKPITMSLSLPKEKFVLEEPIHVKVSFRNNTDRTLYMPIPSRRTGLGFEATCDGKPVKTGAGTLDRHDVFIKIAPRQDLYAILYLQSCSGVRAPGRYALKVGFGDRSGGYDESPEPQATYPRELLLAETTFDIIRTPAGLVDRRVRSYISHEYTYRTSSRDFEHAGAMVLALYPDSAFEPYARLWLARSLESRQRNREAAIMYRRQLEAYPNIPDRDELEYRAILCEWEGMSAKLKNLRSRTRNLDVIRQIEVRLSASKREREQQRKKDNE